MLVRITKTNGTVPGFSAMADVKKKHCAGK